MFGKENIFACVMYNLRPSISSITDRNCNRFFKTIFLLRIALFKFIINLFQNYIEISLESWEYLKHGKYDSCDSKVLGIFKWPEKKATHFLQKIIDMYLNAVNYLHIHDCSEEPAKFVTRGRPKIL